jgi:integrase
MPRTGENIYKRKDGRWEGRYVKGHKPSGKAIYGYVYAHSYKGAKEKLNMAVSGVSLPSVRKVPGSTLLELSEQWLKSKQLRVKESTYNKYQNVVRKYILPHIGQVTVNDLTHAHIQELCDTLLNHGGKNGKGLSEKTVADTIGVIRSITQYAVAMGHSSSFDVRAVHVRCQPRELRILSQRDQQALYAYLCDHPSRYNAGILICMLTGLRIGEVCALRWENISFEDHTMYIHQTVQRVQSSTDPNKKTKLTVTSPKSVSGKRHIPMPQCLEETLLDLDSAKTGYLLSEDGLRITEPRVLQYHFKKVLKELEIEDVNFHILRHSFATRCIELGFDVKSLSEILGHSNVNITMNKYVHPTMVLKHENMQRLSSLFSVK